jgi:hypothetical protein
MNVQRAIAGILVTVSFIVLAAIGQDDRSHEQENAQAQVTNCQTAMPVILKQYNNANTPYKQRGTQETGDTYWTKSIRRKALSMQWNNH